VVVNDAGTMKQVALTDFETYFESALDTLSNVTTVGALNAGSITSGFGTIDTGSSTITTTGAITGGSLVVDNFTLNGTELDLSSGDFTLDVAGDIILNTDDGIVSLQDASTTFGSLENSSGNLVIKSGTTTALTFSGANATIAGDLTISGDDLTMGTNTSGHIMVADGTNFNPVAVSGDVTIASDGAVTIANDAVETAMINANIITGQTAETSLDTSNDVILIHDASASALRKTTLASISSALGGITDVVADTSPQLGGDLDVNGNGIVSTSNGNIALTPNGSGVVRIDGSNGIDMQSGAISIKNSGTQSYIDFYCESSNAHYARLQAPAHSAFSGNITLTMPATTDTLIGRTTTDTLTNKTLTSPKINEDVALTATATELNLLDGVSGLVQADFTKLAAVDSTSTELNLVDGSSAGTIVNSKAVIYGSSGEVNATTLQIGGVSITASAADINLIDGITNGTVIASKAIITDANKDISGGRNITISGELDAATLDISGDADIDGTLEADAITVNGTALNTVIANEATALAIALG
jgi:hypothetical protein